MARLYGRTRPLNRPKRRFPARAVSKTSLTLAFGGMPKASATAAEAVTSAVSTSKTIVRLGLVCETASAPAFEGDESRDAHSSQQMKAEAAPPPVVPGLVAHYHAGDITGAAGSNLTTWANRVSDGPAAEHPGTGSCAGVGPYGPPVVAAGKNSHGRVCHV